MKIFISDWDGSLLNSLPVYYAAVCHIFRHYGIEPPPLDDYRDHIQPDFMPFYWKRGIPWNATAQHLNAIRKEVFNGEARTVELHKGARELLEFCKREGWAFFLATSEIDEILLSRLDSLGITVFGPKELIYGAARNGVSRYEDISDILAFMDGFRSEDPDSFEVVYLDDTAGGLAAAKERNLGKYYTIKTIAFTGGFNSRNKLEAANPDLIVDSLLDIPTILTAPR